MHRPWCPGPQGVLVLWPAFVATKVNIRVRHVIPGPGPPAASPPPPPSDPSVAPPQSPRSRRLSRWRAPWPLPFCGLPPFCLGGSVKHLYDNKTRPHDLAHLEKPHGSWRSDPTSLPPRPGSDQWIGMGRRIQRHIKHGQTMANDDASAHSATAAPLNPGKSGASGAGASQATLRGI